MLAVDPSGSPAKEWSGAKDSELNSGARSLRSRRRFEAVLALETSFDAICSAAAGGSDEGGTAARGAGAGKAAGLDAGEVETDADAEAEADAGLEGGCELGLPGCRGALEGDCSGRIMPPALPPTAIGAAPWSCGGAYCGRCDCWGSG